MTLREQIKNSLKRTLTSERNLAEELLVMIDRISDVELILWLESLWNMAVAAKSWENFLVDVLQLNSDKCVVVHYPRVLGDDYDGIYHVVGITYEHVRILLDFFCFQDWLGEVRIEVDDIKKSEELINYILTTPKFKDMKIVLFTEQKITSSYMKNPRIDLK